MSSETDASRSHSFIAYLVIRNRGQEGFDSGYLCCDQDGTPIEYRYTEPVKASRIQELLYGPSLKPVLFGQCILAQLLKTIEQKPALIVTDQDAVLEGYKGSAIPIIHVTANLDNLMNERSCQLQTPGGTLKLTWRSEDASAVKQLLQHLENTDVQERLHRTRSVLEELSHSEKASSGEMS